MDGACAELFTTFETKIELRTFKNFCFDLTKKLETNSRFIFL